MLTVNPDIFREFSIRGVADTDLTDEVVIAIGQSIGVYFNRQGLSSIVVGNDVRLSSVRISRALIKGLTRAGMSVTDIGEAPTPVLNFTVDSIKADGGVMITASHNPPPDNGFKIRTNHILDGDELQEIYKIISSLDPPDDKLPQGQAVKTLDPLPAYFDRLKSLIDQPLDLKVVVDGGNGTNGQIVSQMLGSVGCQVVELFCEPDGNFPNRTPDPTKSGAIDALSARVQAEKANLGVAYDGDGDRLAVVDEQGNVILGDQIMMILARDVLRQQSARIIVEILCTQALADDIIAHGGEPILVPSGYAFVYHAMHNHGAAVGGELSGHLFFNEPGFDFDDAILGTVKLLNIIKQSQTPLSQMVAALPAYHSSPELRLSCPDAVKGKVVEQVKSHFEREHKVDTLDGARIHFDNGWALVRQSNTQPRLSMRFEARSAAGLEAIQSSVQPFVEAKITELTDSSNG